ncbi:transcriptional regulator [Prauserella endophytica]|uniref:Transcriptional regulator n=1 Tax=Prauserella endophytica TaxID=1592324 RepID=A0ABY2S1L6_9PSEU|nr:transcriptional regulator [Prauserella endophytica]TKG68340.1 transcriptional regulator [Prauserella endophytica]
MAAAPWTGRTACALQNALRLSNELFAEHLGIGVRTVASWHQKPTLKPKSEMQQLLDTAYERASPVVLTRFAELVGDAPSQRSAEPAADDKARADAELRLADDPHVGAALEWLDTYAGWNPGTSRRQVAAQLADLDVRALRDRGARRGQISHAQATRSLLAYYGSEPSGYGTYAAKYHRERLVDTTILTRPDWLDLECRLLGGSDDLRFDHASPPAATPLDGRTVEAAIRRLAETLELGTRLVNMPLYRLRTIDIEGPQLSGTLGLAPFVQYALTMDLLEGELLDAISADGSLTPGRLPLRDQYLPDLASVARFDGRLCAGGVLALCAIARPRGLHGDADYLILVQQRSGSVVNANRQLAVIPKGFHQPVADLRGDTQVGATLLREMEEELFGRDDVDNTVGEQRSADPMHSSRLSQPMRWLLENPVEQRFRLECTGFGLNLVSGNYEFPSLIVIEDEEFWVRFGGQIEANWESSNLRRYSTLDTGLLSELLDDVAWSNEGLFAVLQGFRRLAELGGRRVRLPHVEWELK